MADVDFGLTLRADSQGLQAGVGQAREQIDQLGQSTRRTGSHASQMGAQAQRASRLAQQGFRISARAAQRLAGQLSSVQSLLAGVGVTLGGIQFARLTQGALDTAESMTDMADQVDLGVERLQALRLAADQMGASVGEIDGALRRFTRRVGLAAEGSGAAASAVERHGIALRNAGGNMRDTEAILDDVIDEIAAMESRTEQAALASEFFGDRAGPQLVSMLSEGSDALQRFQGEAREAGELMRGDVAQAGAEAAADLRRLRQAVETGMQTEIIAAFVDEFGSVESAITEVSDVAEEFGQTVGSSMSTAAEAAEWLANNLDKVAAAGGAVVGLKLGAAFGPWGAAIGGLSGAVAGMYSNIGDLNEGLSRQEELTRMATGATNELTGSLRAQAQAYNDLSDAQGRTVDQQVAELDQRLADLRARRAELREDLASGDTGASPGPDAERQLDLINQRIEDTEARIDELIGRAREVQELPPLDQEIDVQPRQVEPLSTTGLSDEQRNQAHAHIGEALQRHQEHQAQLAREASRVIDETRTPLQAYRRELELLEELRASGRIDADQHARGIEQATEQYRAAQREASELRAGVQDVGQAFRQTTTQMITGAQSAEEAVASLGQRIQEIAVDRTIGAGVENLVTGGLDAIGDSISAGVGHSGGPVDRVGGSRSVPESLFAGAPRYHSGGPVGAHEVPIVAQRGEVVGWPDQMRRAYGGGGDVNVQVIDQRGGDAPDVEVEEQRQPGGGKRVGLLLRREQAQGVRDGDLDGAMRERYGIRPKTRG